MRIRLLVVIGVVCTSLLIVGPFAWLLFSSLKPPEELFLASLIPSHLTLQNYGPSLFSVGNC
jgi:ABC-type glycerol-3-phosphate transport system permease component